MTSLKFISDNWEIFAAIGAIVVSYLRYENKVNNLERRTNYLEEKIEKMDTTFLQLQKDIVEIKTTLLFIKEKVK